jgi:hypothetical protein
MELIIHISVGIMPLVMFSVHHYGQTLKHLNF